MPAEPSLDVLTVEAAVDVDGFSWLWVECSRCKGQSVDIAPGISLNALTTPLVSHKRGCSLQVHDGGVQLINGVNVANTPAFPPDGKCPTCGEPVTATETSVSAGPRLRESTDRVPPPKFKGPYYVPCGHDAADTFGGRV